MDAATMRNAGLRVSLQVSDEEVTRAYNDAERCYLRKVVPRMDRPTAAEHSAWMMLTYILLLRRTAGATRSGGKAKLSPSLSDPAGPSQEDLESADSLLREVQAEERNNGAVQGNLSQIVDDIAGIYYRNTFVGL